MTMKRAQRTKVSMKKVIQRNSLMKMEVKTEVMSLWRMWTSRK
jgi:hypothetical protein